MAAIAPRRYDTPDTDDNEDEEVEIEISSAGRNGDAKPSDRESTALEFSADGMIPDGPLTTRQRLRNFIRLPNSAIKETWSKLDISEEGICEQEEYGEARDGIFWKYVHETLFGSSTLHGQFCGVILLLMITASVVLGAFASRLLQYQQRVVAH